MIADFPNTVIIEPTNRCRLNRKVYPRRDLDMSLGDIRLSLFSWLCDQIMGI